jgi:adenosylcobinamide-GDP ribazoletransferase
MWQSFLIAVQFLTRWPVRCEWSPEAAGLSLLFYPVVGLLLGVVLAVVSTLLAGGDLSAAVLVVAVWVLLTGGLHLDGLADSADAWIGGHGDRDKTLAIMKDPYVGPLGVVALVLVLALKWSALAGLMAEGEWLPLVLAPVLARTAVLALFYATPYARESGLGSALAEHLPRREAARVLLLVAVLVAVAGGGGGIWALLIAFAVLVLLRSMMLKRIGGTTGDTAGATIELVEAAVLAGYALG